MPQLRRSSSVLRRVCKTKAGLITISRWARRSVGDGTANTTITAPTQANPADNINTPANPVAAARAGPKIIASEKDKPMEAPMAAIALVRFSSEVRSATMAIIALAMAPLPCKARPSTKPSMVVAWAATTLPSAKIAKPAKIIGLRPTTSDNRPSGI